MRLLVVMALLFCGCFVFTQSNWSLPEGFWDIPDEKTLPFNDEIVSETTENGIYRKAFTFTSQRVRGIDYRTYAVYACPANAASLPTILFVHGAGGTADPKRVAFWAEHGYASLSFDWTGKRGGNAHHSTYDPANTNTDTLFTVPVVENNMYYSIISARRAIRWLTKQPAVDAAKIGAEGISFGGFRVLMLSGIEPIIKAVANIYGAGFWYEYPQQSGGAFGVTGPLIYKTPAERAEWLYYLDPGHYIQRAHAPIYYLTGTGDIFFWLPIVERSYKATPTEKRLWLEPNVNHTLSLNAGGVGPAEVLWFDFHLKGKGALPPNCEEPEIRTNGAAIDVSFALDNDSEAQKATINCFWHKKEPSGPYLLSAFNQKDSHWDVVPATGSKGRYRASLPAVPSDAKGLTVYGYAQIADGIAVSSITKTITLSAASGDGNHFPDPSFEKRSASAAKIVFVGKPEWDENGGQANTGKSALRVNGSDKNYFVADAPVSEGRRYRFSLFCKSEHDGMKARLQINWQGSKPFKYELKTPRLSAAYQKYEVIADAPPGTTSAHIIVGGGSGADEWIWVDDLFFSEVK